MAFSPSKDDLARVPARSLKASKEAIEFIKGFEMFVPYVYDDLIPPKKGKYAEWKGGPVKGTLTIGYGHTDAAKHPLKISKGLRITEAQACEILDVDLDDCEESVRKAVTVPITQGMFDALVSFAFNCGAGNMRNIAKRINAGKEAEARAAFDLYTKSKGITLRGLQRRRDGEQALWDATQHAPIVVADAFHPAEVDTPEPPAAPEASELIGISRKVTLLVRFKKFIAWTGIGGGSAVTFADITDNQEALSYVAQFISQNPRLSVVAILSCIGLVGYVMANVLIRWHLEDVQDGRYIPKGAADGRG